MGTKYTVSNSGDIDADGYISIGNGTSATYRVNNVQISTTNLSDGATIPDLTTSDTITGNWSFTNIGGIEVTNDVNAGTFTGNGAALTSLSEANITDGAILARVASTETISGAWTFTNGGTALTVSGNTSLNGTVVVNDAGADKDFRIEGTIEPNLLYTDASLSRVGIGTSSPTETLDVAYGVGLFRGAISVGASPAGNLNESGTFFSIYGRAGKGLALGANDNPGAIAAIQINSTDTAVVVNETGVDRDFRVEGDTLTHLLFTDASTDRVGVGDSTPNALLTVGGVVSLAETTAPTSTANYGKVYVKSTDSKLYFMDDSSTEFDLTAASALSADTLVWTKYTFSEAAFTAGATSESIELFSLAAAGVIHGVKIKHSTAFTGGGLTAFTVEVGIVGDESKYAQAFNVFQATSNTTFQLSSVLGSENHGAATSIKITARSTGANVSAATAGSVDVWVLTSSPN